MESAVSRSTIAKRSAVDRATYTLAEFAGLLGRSYTATHEAAQRGDLPVKPLRVGRMYLFPKAIVDRMLGLDQEGEAAA